MTTDYPFLVSPPLNTEKHSQYAYRNIRQNIMDCRLKPGELINEAQLASIMNISRTPVHEAVLTLQDEKLIDVIPRKESRVSYIDTELVNEAIFLRCAVESELIRSLAGNIGPDYLSMLTKNVHQQQVMFLQSGDLFQFFQADDEFHYYLYLSANKTQTYTLVHSLSAHLDRIRHFVRLENDIEIHKASLEEHELILHYLMMGVSPDIDLNLLFRRHIYRVQSKLPMYLAKYKSFFSPGSI